MQKDLWNRKIVKDIRKMSDLKPLWVLIILIRWSNQTFSVNPRRIPRSKRYEKITTTILSVVEFRLASKSSSIKLLEKGSANRMYLTTPRKD